MENLGEELEVEASPDEGLDAAELDELASTASEE